MSKNKRKSTPHKLLQKPIQPIDTSNLPKATICLSVICKNESNVLLRYLNSVYPILDRYVVVDTGSTDGSQKIIEDFFAEKGIPGRVVQHEWVNFEDARNKAYNEAKVEGCTFGFWMDCDEVLTINPGFNVDVFKHNLMAFDGANIRVTYGRQNYYRMQFMNFAKNWRWYGPVHEVLVCDTDARVGEVDGLGVLVNSDGNSWTSESIKSKYEGHAKILEAYVAQDEKKDPRWVFYLAQSYRDAGGTPENNAKALEWYLKRSEMTNGYWEEVYYSLLMATGLKAALQCPVHEFIESALKCGKYNRWRAEHLMPVIIHYHSIKEFDIAYIYSSHAMKFAGKLPFPHSSLFIDTDIYTWKIYDIHTISCYYSNRLDEAKETFKLLKAAMDKGLIPESEIPRIKENGKYLS